MQTRGRHHRIPLDVIYRIATKTACDCRDCVPQLEKRDRWGDVKTLKRPRKVFPWLEFFVCLGILDRSADPGLADKIDPDSPPVVQGPHKHGRDQLEDSWCRSQDWSFFRLCMDFQWIPDGQIPQAIRIGHSKRFTGYRSKFKNCARLIKMGQGWHPR